MCDFAISKGNKTCMDRTCKEYDKLKFKKESCPTCEEKMVNETTYDDGCGLACCLGGLAPCGSGTCPFSNQRPDCSDGVCPYKPPVIEPCYRDDGTLCNPAGAMATCLMDDGPPRKKDYLSKFKYVDFSKYTFNKDKYLPSSYLPGDGSDFMYGYGLQPTSSEMGGGPCGSPTCPMASLDFLLDKLNKPLPDLPTLYNSQNKANVDYCGGEACPKGPPPPACPYATPPPRPCPFAKFHKSKLPPKEPSRGSRSDSAQDTCGAPDCPYAAKKETCGAPDCPYRAKKPCGAPDCKYANQEQVSEGGDYYGDSSQKKKKKKRKSQGDFDSTASCDSSVCPFAGMKQTSGSDDSSKVSCDNPECPFAQKEKECNDKNCPYAKELVICQDCGGIILEDIDIKQGDSITIQEEGEDKAVRTSVAVNDKQRRQSMTKNGDPDKRGSASNDSDEEASKYKKLKPKIHREVLYSYPGVQIGHRTCMKRGKNIPANMGWAWNKKPAIGDPELWRGYRPGAISKTVHKMIKQHRRDLGIFDPSEMPRKKKSKTSTKTQSDKNKRCIEVKKKEGNYTVTVNPVKDPYKLDDFENPYMDCTPMQFTIIKPEKPPKKPKQVIDENGCLCDDEEEEEPIDSSSDESELEFSFSPPAALPDLKPRKKKVKATIDTQYDPEDYNPKPKPDPKAIAKASSSTGKSKKGKKKK